MRRAAIAVLLLSACDVEASLGAHDAGGADAMSLLDGSHTPDTGHAVDAFIAEDAGTDAAVIDDAGIDAAHLVDAAHAVDGGIDAAHALDAGLDAHGAVCATPDAGACIQCQAAMCCAEYTACQAAPSCPCIVDCIFAGHTAAECAMHCGADHGESTALASCAQHACTCP